MVRTKKTKSLFRRTVSSIMALAIIATNFATNLSVSAAEASDKTTTAVEITEGSPGDGEADEEADENLDNSAESESEGSDDTELSEQEIIGLIEEESPPVNVNEDESVVESSDYILSNINTDYAAADKLEAMDLLLVKQTMAVGSLLPIGNKTIDALWLADNGAYQAAFVNQAASHVYLYNTDDDSDYFVAYANTVFTDDSLVLSDWAFAYNNTAGEAVDDCIYDENTGLVYVPKEYTIENKNGVGFGNIQVQFLQLVDSYQPTVNVDVIVDDTRIKGEIADTGTAEYNANSGFTNVQLAGDSEALDEIEPEYIKVYVNDVETSAFSYDSDNGAILISHSPLTISSLKIEVTKPSAASRAATWVDTNVFGSITAYADDNTDGKKYVIDGEDWRVHDSWTLSGTPKVNDTFVIDANLHNWNGAYDSDNSTTYLGNFVDDASGYELTDYDINAMILLILQNHQLNQLEFNNSNFYYYDSDFFKLSNISSVLDGYMCVIKKLNTMAEVTSKTTSGIYTVNASQYAMTCAHITAGINADLGDNIPSTDGTGKVRFRVLTVTDTSGNGTSGYMTVGVTTTPIGSQSGSGAFRINWSSPPKTVNVKITKASSKPSITDNNPNYSLEGAVFRLTVKGGTTSYDATTNSSGVAEFKNLPSTVDYTLTEFSAPKGYKKWNYSVTIYSTELAKNAGGTYTYPTPIQEIPETGTIRVKKTSADKCISDNNSNYKFNDGTFKVYYNSDFFGSKKGTVAGTMTWSSSDNCYVLSGLPYGNYQVEETKAPSGFVATTGRAGATISAAEPDKYATRGTEANSWQNKALDDPLSLLLIKIDKDSEDGRAQGDGTLAGAQFTVRFYSDIAITRKELEDDVTNKIEADNSKARSSLLFSATFETIDMNDEGFIFMSMNHLVSGSFKSANGYTIDDYINSKGEFRMPAGTLSIVETKAPEGYIIDNSVVFRRFEFNSDKTYIICYDEDHKVLTDVTTFGNIYEAPNEEIHGDADVIKVDSNTNTIIPQGDAELWAEYTLFNKSTKMITYNDKEYAPGSIVAVLNTRDSEDNKVTFKDLPYGTYEIIETDCSDDYTNSGFDETFSIREDGEVVTLTNANPVKRGYVQGYKFTKDFGTTVPQGDATLAGAEFTIWNESKRAVYIKGTKYEPGDIIMTLTTDSNGYFSTEPDCLPIGTYRIAETKAPEGYMLDGNWDKEFSIRNDSLVYSYTDLVWNDVNVKTEDNACGNTNPRGSVEIAKYDADSKTTVHQGNADLWAEYTIYNCSKNPVMVGGKEYAVDDVIAVLRTNEDVDDGTVTLSDLPYGTYEIVETDCSKDYKNAGFDKTFSIRKDGQIVDYTGVDNANQNLVKRGGVLVQKFTDEFMEAEPSGDGTLENAEFTIWNISENSVWIDGNEVKPNGVVCKIYTNEDGIAQTAREYLPVGRYRIKETAPSEGYLLNEDWVKEFDITATDSDDKASFEEYTDIAISKTNNTGDFYATPETPIRGGVQLQKWDIELDKSESLGGENRLSGIQFEITNQSKHKVKVDGKIYQPGEVVKVITTHWNEDKQAYTAETANDTLPYGTYGIQEIAQSGTDNMIKANDYYLLTDGKMRTFEIRVQNEIVEADTSSNLLIFKNAVIRDDIDFVKIANTTSERMYTLWIITSNETGERHIIATNEDGEYYSNTDYVPHTQNTNAFDDMFLDRIDNGEMISMDEVTEYIEDNGRVGTWFGIGEFGTQSPVSDSRGAFPFGNYTISEVRTDTNYGYNLQEFDFVINRDGYNHTLGTITNDKIEIKTVAVDDGTGEHFGLAEEDIIIEDTVDYNYLVPGKEYTMKGTLINKDTGAVILDSDGNEVVAETTFTPTESFGSVKVMFRFNGTLIAGTRTVVFEDLYEGENKVATHSNIDDEDQSISYPKIKTLAIGDKTNDHDLPAVENVTITDTVEYSGLTVGKKYTISGVLMDATDNDEVIDAKGREVRSEVTFTAESESGTVDITFTFDASNLAGHTVVAFESLEYRNQRIALHADIEDEDQTVHFPKIGTVATDKHTGDSEGVTAEKTVLVDTVRYDNLVIGKEYTMYGTLMNKATGEAVKDSDGNEITANTVFTPSETSGYVDVVFTFDATVVAGEDVVAFERLERVGIELATHTDIEDEDQTIHYPDIKTSARYGDTDMQEGLAAEDAVIIDTVTYTNLTPGREYTLVGTLMDQSTGNAVKTADGNVITAKTVFTPSEKNGSIEVEFKFDATDYAGDTFVVFEELSRIVESGDSDSDISTAIALVTVATHKNINDKDQTINFPEIGTTLTDSVTADHDAMASETIKLVDNVAYKNLTVGKEYVMSGILMNKKTNEPVLDDSGNEITAETKFTAEKTDGFVEVVFEFSGVNLAGESVVAFEDCTRDGIEVAVHADINDTPQTVDFPKIRTTATDSETGDDEGIVGEKTVLIDTVAYENLNVGVQYDVTGVLMNKSTGEKLLDADGNEITASASFIPEESDGSVEVTFEFDSTLVAGTDVVVFENLYRDEFELAVHADIEDDGQTVHYPDIKTSAKSGDTGMQEGIAAEDATIIDTVTYTNLRVGQKYVVTGKLMNKDTNNYATDADGNVITASVEFTPEESDGTVDVEFKFDARPYAGQTFVVFEDLYRNDVLIITHADIDDVDQTVNFPNIKTTLTDTVSNSHEAMAAETVKLVDTVVYSNLTVGEEYVMSGVLMNKKTNEPMLDDNGKEITASKTFVPESKDGVVEIVFEFSGVNLAGESVVAFEDCTRNDIEVAVHADINDAPQTVSFPKMKTILHKYEIADEKSDEETSSEVSVPESAVTTDSDVATATAVSTLSSTVDSSSAANETDSQTDDKTSVVNTEATDDAEYIKTVYLSDNIQLTDEVICDNLTIGNEYVVKGVLMNGETGKAITDKDGNEITAETTFVAKDTSVTVQLEFVFDGTVTDAKLVVAFDELYVYVDETNGASENEDGSATSEIVRNAYLMAEGKDLNDEDETIEIVPPEIGTVALGEKTGTHMLESGESVVIVDTVNYKNLNPGTLYTVKGTLMNKETGKELLDKDGKTIVSSTEFTPETPNGSVQVKFTVDSTLLQGQTIVVFEDAYINDIKVVSHADIEDENQTVYVMEIGTVATGADGRSKTVDISKNVVIKDTVSFKNLVVGEEYAITGAVMNKKTGEQVGETVQVKFKPEKPDGVVDVEFTVDTTELSGETLVCFEKIYDMKGVLLGSHCDINDEDQSVVVKTTTKVQTGIQTYSGIAAMIALCAVAVFMLTATCVVVYKKRKLGKIKRDNF